MKVVIAPDGFKECLTSDQVCAAIARGIRRGCSQAAILEVPMADGGQGTVAAMVRATDGIIRHTTVTGPLGEPVDAAFGILGDGTTAVIEMAAASGLQLVPRERRNPWVTTSRGTGELILEACATGAKRVLVGIGGSATNDGGAGMAQALGFDLLDASGQPIEPGGGALAHLDRIGTEHVDARLDQVILEVACDVTNPLLGPQGASAVYGPQKGATEDMVARLDANLAHFARIIERDLGANVADIPGAGAAGGLGAGLMAFTHARLRRGVELVIEAVGLSDRLAGADLCFTGEGSIDASSQFGKTAVGVAAVAREQNVPVVALCGAFDPVAAQNLIGHFAGIFDVTLRPMTLEQAMSVTEASLAAIAEQVVRLFQAR